MRNHDQKARDMARSILPSTGRHGARNRKVRSARRARARNTARLRRLAAYIHDLDDFGEDLHRYDLDDTGWDGMVEDRRSCDKVAPLIRWAEARIEGTPQLCDGDYWVRRNYFAHVLGDTVSGRHALQHLDPLFGVLDPWEYGSYPDEPSFDDIDRKRRSDERAERDRRERRLAEVVAGAGPARLNARIRALTPPLEKHWRYLEDGSRVPAPDSGHDPWLVGGDTGLWLALPRVRWGRGKPTIAQSIAFEALDQVHAEMFGCEPT